MRCNGQSSCRWYMFLTDSVVTQHGKYARSSYFLSPLIIYLSTKSSITDPTLKTRYFADIIHEITRSMQIHREKGTILGGVHLELTGEVNEEGYSVVSGSLTSWEGGH